MNCGVVSSGDEWENLGPAAPQGDNNIISVVVSGAGETVASDEEGDASAADEEELELVTNWAAAYSVEDIKQLQEADPCISMVRGWLVEERTRAPPRDELSLQSEMVRGLASQFRLLRVEDGVVYRIIPNKIDTSRDDKQYVVPTAVQESLMKSFHEKAGHWATTKVVQLLKSRGFYWPGMKKHIDNYVFGCVSCGRVKHSRRNTIPLAPFPRGAFNEMVNMDIWRAPVESVSGFRYVLGLCDKMTKLVRLLPMREKTALACANELIDNWCFLWGFPSSIVSDRDAAWAAEVSKELATLCRIEWRKSCPYSPSTDGGVERVFRTLNRFFRQMVAGEQSEWEHHLKQVEFFINNSVNQSTGQTPYFLMHGFEANFPNDILWPTSNRYKMPRFKCATEYAQWLLQSTRRIHRLARATLGKTSHRMKQQYDAKLFPEFKLGEYCYRYVPPGNKGVASWRGPGRIIRKLSDSHVLFQLTPESDVMRLNVKNIKPYNSTRIPSNWVVPPAQETESDRGQGAISSDDENDAALVSSQTSSSDEVCEDDDDPIVEAPRRSARTRKTPVRMDL